MTLYRWTSRLLIGAQIAAEPPHRHTEMIREPRDRRPSQFCQREGEFLARCSEKAWRIDQALNKYADESLTQPKGIPMLWTIIVILVILWLLVFIGHVGGSLIPPKLWGARHKNE